MCRWNLTSLVGPIEFSTEELEESLAKAQVIYFEAESSSFKPSKPHTRNVRHSSNPHNSDSV